MTRLATVRCATQFKLDASGREGPFGYTVRKPVAVVSVAVTFMTTAVALPGTLPPRRARSTLPPGPMVWALRRVSRTRTGETGWEKGAVTINGCETMPLH